MEQSKPAYELKVAAEQGRFEDEGWRVRKDGSRFWANVVITALRDATGCLRGVQSYLVFPNGTPVKVSLALPNDSTPLQFEARVMRTVGTDRMGIEFKNLGAKESSQLQEFLLPLILAAA